MVACSDSDADPVVNEEAQEEKVDGKEEAESTVKSFMDAYVGLEFDKLKDYVVDEDEIPEEISKLDIAATFETTMSNMPEELAPYSKEFEGLFNDIIDIFKKEFTYEIKDTDGEDDEYTVAVEVTIPDVENIDFEAIIGDSMSEDAMTVLVADLVESGKITETSTEKEIMDIIVAEVIKIAKESVANTDITTVTKEIELVVVESDGEWLVDIEESDLN